MQIIQEKVKKGGKLPLAKLEQKTAGVVDRMAALEKGLADSSKRKPAKVTAIKAKARKAG